MIFLLPEILILLAALSLLLVGTFFRPSPSVLAGVISAFLGVVFLVILLMDSTSHVVFNGSFLSDSFSKGIKALIVGSSAFLLFSSRKILALEDLSAFEFPLLMLLAILGMMLMVSANDLLVFFLGLEIQNLSLYVLTGMRRENVKASEASLKYFILGALATGILLYGCSLVYGFTGTISFETLGRPWVLDSKVLPPLGYLTGITFILVGVAFKIAVVPFHMWVPDVYEGTPSAVTAFLATAAKIAAFALLIRLLIGPFYTIAWRIPLSVIAALSMGIGALGALHQTNFKRLLAYGAVGHMGYGLMALSVGTEDALMACLSYLGSYLVMSVGVFTLLLILTSRMDLTGDLTDFQGLVKRFPLIGFTLALFLFSMAGLPPFIGIWGKFIVFQTVIASGGYELALWGVLTSVVAAFYYLMIIKRIVIDEPPLVAMARGAVVRDATGTLTIWFVLFVLLGVSCKPSFLFKWANNMATSLFYS